MDDTSAEQSFDAHHQLDEQRHLMADLHHSLECMEQLHETVEHQQIDTRHIPSIDQVLWGYSPENLNITVSIDDINLRIKTIWRVIRQAFTSIIDTTEQFYQSSYRSHEQLITYYQQLLDQIRQYRHDNHMAQNATFHVPYIYQLAYQQSMDWCQLEKGHEVYATSVAEISTELFTIVLDYHDTLQSSYTHGHDDPDTFVDLNQAYQKRLVASMESMTPLELPGFRQIRLQKVHQQNASFFHMPTIERMNKKEVALTQDVALPTLEQLENLTVKVIQELEAIQSRYKQLNQLWITQKQVLEQADQFAVELEKSTVNMNWSRRQIVHALRILTRDHVNPLQLIQKHRYTYYRSLYFALRRATYQYSQE